MGVVEDRELHLKYLQKCTKVLCSFRVHECVAAGVVVASPSIVDGRRYLRRGFRGRTLCTSVQLMCVFVHVMVDSWFCERLDAG